MKNMELDKFGQQFDGQFHEMLYFGVDDENSLGTGTEEILQVQVEVKETNIWPILQ